MAFFIWALYQLHSWETLMNRVFHQEWAYHYFGFVAFTFCLRIYFFKKKKFRFLIFLDTLEHEFSHIFVGFLHFKSPGELKVSESGNGHITLNNISTFICLAPYVFPLWALALWTISPLFQNQFIPYIQGAGSILLGNYLFRLYHEIHKGQSDFQLAGYFVSVVIIFQVNIAWLSLLIFDFLNISSYSNSFIRSLHFLKNHFLLLMN